MSRIATDGELGKLCALTGALLLLGVGGASAQVPPRTMIASPPVDGAASAPPPADGGSDNAAISQDNRDVRLVAFDSAATNLVVPDVNGRRDVFVLRKNQGAGALGGRLFRVSVGLRGR